MQRYFIRCAYKGTNYHGWQIQPNAISVQEVINNALSVLLNTKTNCVGCGRTDTGVHALDFMLHFDTDVEFDIEKFKIRINRFLPQDISVFEIMKVRNDYHTRFDAISRAYIYKISTIKHAFRQDTHWTTHYDLNIEQMNEACKILFEYIDFTSFSKLHTDTKTNNCKIMEAKWEQKSDEILFLIKADRFLRNMVRAIVGTMVELGRGKIDLNEFRQIIESKNRCKAGVSVPSQGLYLSEIKYDEQELKH
ncbi:MAG: tRNA pseudouridine(38-40) synthase TruA [Marinifilaceae bacterium]|jgi:tRNA pseudouridine38-40 synthase|nr:tRNA pseudouridine(38-40) synthase TruA [Marinifilaceae bacterium]